MLAGEDMPFASRRSRAAAESRVAVEEESAIVPRKLNFSSSTRPAGSQGLRSPLGTQEHHPPISPQAPSVTSFTDILDDFQRKFGF